MLASSSRLTRLALVFALLAAPSAALGYGIWVHYVALRFLAKPVIFDCAKFRLTISGEPT